LFIITPFEKTIKRVTEQTAATRNKKMINLADSISVGFASAGGQLEELLKGIEKSINKIILPTHFERIPIIINTKAAQVRAQTKALSKSFKSLPKKFELKFPSLQKTKNTNAHPKFYNAIIQYRQ